MTEIHTDADTGALLRRVTGTDAEANPLLLDEAATYGAFRVTNLRTGACSQFAYCSGTSARLMAQNSTEPRRLLFVRVG